MIEVIYLGSVFCALLTVYVLLFKKDALRSYADYLLATFFVFQAWAVIIYLLIYSGWITNVPHFYKTAAPFNFIFPVLTYLYVRAVLYNEKGFSRKDIWHLMPFVIFIINYLPFFILPTQIKLDIVNATTKDLNQAYKYQAGYIPEELVYLFRIFQTLVYLVFQWRLIINYKKNNNNALIENQINAIVKWLKIFTWASTLFVIAFIGLTFLAITFNTINVQGILNYTPGLFISISFLVISSYLVTHPGILDGLPFIKYKEGEKNVLNEDVEKVPFIEENYSNEIEMIDAYFISDHPYLKNNFSICHLSVALAIPIRDISYIINNYYGMRFTDFVNSHRIKHIIEKYNESYLDKFTIESVALDAGFSSRSNFYKSFNKLYKMTPLEFFNDHISKTSL
jgi:AraC-like DNA-binding protein